MDSTLEANPRPLHRFRLLHGTHAEPVIDLQTGKVKREKVSDQDPPGSGAPETTLYKQGDEFYSPDPLDQLFNRGAQKFLPIDESGRALGERSIPGETDEQRLKRLHDETSLLVGRMVQQGTLSQEQAAAMGFSQKPATATPTVVTALSPAQAAALGKSIDQMSDQELRDYAASEEIPLGRAKTRAEVIAAIKSFKR